MALDFVIDLPCRPKNLLAGDDSPDEGVRRLLGLWKLHNIAEEVRARAEASGQNPYEVRIQLMVARAGESTEPTALTLPYVEQGNLKRVVDANAAASGQYYAITYNQSPPKIFINPTDPANSGGAYTDGPWGVYSVTGYVANYAATGCVVKGTGNAPVQQRMRDLVAVTDGTSNTILYTQRVTVCKVSPQPHRPGYVGDYYNIAPYANAGSWYQWMPVINYWPQGTASAGHITGAATKYQSNPTWNSASGNCDYRLASAMGSSGILVCMGDGSVRGVSTGVSGDTWWAAMTPDGGEVLASDW